MELITTRGDKMFINEESLETYKNYLNNTILEFKKAAETRGLTKAEELKANECMYLYNQIVDYQRNDSFKEPRSL